MVKKTVQHFWSADIEIKTLKEPGLCFAVQTEEDKVKGRKINRFRMNWLEGDKVMFDAGARLRGWLKMQSKTIRPSLGDIVNYGVRTLTLPVAGKMEIAKISELVGQDKPSTSLTDDYKLPDELNETIAYPIKEAFSVGEGKLKRAIYAFHYEYPKEITLKARMYSFARGLAPEQVEWMLENLGRVAGVGDRYSRGYGLFTLENFDIVENTEIPL